MDRRAAPVTALAAVLLVGVCRTGINRIERRSPRPGDELVTRPQLQTDHATTLGGRPDDVWPWLAQMGWHLGGFYTPAWVDRWLFPGNWRSLDHLDPRLVRDLRAGDRIPDGPPGTAEYVVAIADRPHALVLRSTSHLPPGWKKRFGATIDWTWCFALTPLADGRTRLHLRVRGHMSPRWVAALYVATLIPADYLMARAMLRGIARRVEFPGPPRESGRPPYELEIRS